MARQEHTVRVGINGFGRISCYHNEWGYSNRLVGLTAFVTGR